METRDSTSNAALSLNRTALCPVLYCYIHSRADFNYLSEQSRFEVSVETSIHLSQKKKKKTTIIPPSSGCVSVLVCFSEA